jgi:hypothetical protein
LSMSRRAADEELLVLLGEFVFLTV